MFPPNPANYQGNVYKDAPPAFGGTLAVASFNFTYTTTTAATPWAALPPGATIVFWFLTVGTTFNGSATLSIGGTASATAYLSAASALGSAGPVYSTAWDATKMFSQLTGGDNLTLTLGGTATQGAASVAVVYMMGSPS